MEPRTHPLRASTGSAEADADVRDARAILRSRGGKQRYLRGDGLQDSLKPPLAGDRKPRALHNAALRVPEDELQLRSAGLNGKKEVAHIIWLRRSTPYSAPTRFQQRHADTSQSRARRPFRVFACRNRAR